MSKEQVEDLVRKLTIDEMKTKWFDEIFEKVKSERKLIVVDAFLPLCNRN
jgi:hypothetical protein